MNPQYTGHFYLTSLLQEKMMAQKHPSRIVVVSSIAHTMGPVTVSDLHFKNGRKYEAWVSYGQSKLANILFTKSLADKLQNTQVQAVCLHPGVIPTKLSRHMNIIAETIFKNFITDKTIPQGNNNSNYKSIVNLVTFNSAI
jgi:NAD(P)-dependent dehydrogenase (short-subunit alcohol dehydrogenase family)